MGLIDQLKLKLKKSLDDFQAGATSLNPLGDTNPQQAGRQNAWTNTANTVVNTKFLPGQKNTLGQVAHDVGRNFNKYNLYSQMASGKLNTGFKPLDAASQFTGNYVQNQIINPTVSGTRQLFTGKSAGEKALGGLSAAQGLSNVIPGKAAVGMLGYNVLGGGAAGLLRSGRTGENALSSVARGISSPTSVASQGLGIQNPLLAAGVDLVATRNPKATLKNLKTVKVALKGYSPRSFNIHPDDQAIMKDFVNRIQSGGAKMDLGKHGVDVQRIAEHYIGKKAGTLTNAQLAKTFDALLSNHAIRRGEDATQTPFPKMGLVADRKVPQVFKTEKFNVNPEQEQSLKATQGKLKLNTRSVRTFDDMKALAEDLGTDPNKLLKAVQTGRITDKEVVALGNAISTSTQRISSLSKQLAKDPANVAVRQQLAAEEQLLNHAIRTRIKGGTEAGRSVAAFRIIANRNLDPVYWLDKAQRQVGEGTPLKPEVVTAINDLIKQKDRLGLAHFINKLGESSGMEKAIGLWKAMLLTGLRTHEANMIGNAAMAGLETVKDIPATAFDIARSAVTGGPRAKSFSLKTIPEQVAGAGEGVKRAARFLKEGVDPEDIAKAELRKPLRFGNTIGGRVAQKATNTVFGALGAEDRVFSQIASRRSLGEQMRLAKINGKPVSNPTQEMIQQAKNDAEYATFTNDNALNDFLKGGKAATNTKVRAGVDVVAPFTKTPTNVAMATFIDYTPVGGVATVAQKLFDRKSVTDKELAEALGRATTGTAVLWLGYELAKRGLVSGASPSGEAERAQQQHLENQPANSVFINGQWRNVARISPFGNLLLLGAAAYENGGNIPQTAFAGLKGFSENSFLKGASNALAAFNEPNRSAGSFVNNALAGYVPNILADVARGTDTFKREPKGLKEQVLSKLPGVRDTVPTKLSPLGEPEKQQGGFLGNTLDPFNSTTPSDDPLVGEFKRVGYNLNFVGDSIANQKLSRSEQREYQKLAGQYIQELVPEVIQSDGYGDLSTDEQRDLVEKAVNAAKGQAREEIKQRLGTITDESGIAAEAAENTDKPHADTNLDLKSGKSKTYTFIKNGKSQTITLDLNVKAPKLSGDTDFDKKLISRYKSKVTSEINDVYDLYEAGKLTLEQAKQAIAALQGGLEKTGGGTKKKGKKISLKTTPLARRKISLPKVQMQQITFPKRKGLSLKPVERKPKAAVKLKKLAKPKVKIASSYKQSV